MRDRSPWPPARPLRLRIRPRAGRLRCSRPTLTAALALLAPLPERGPQQILVALLQARSLLLQLLNPLVQLLAPLLRFRQLLLRFPAAQLPLLDTLLRPLVHAPPVMPLALRLHQLPRQPPLPLQLALHRHPCRLRLQLPFRLHIR